MDFSILQSGLRDLGVNIAANVIYDFFRCRLKSAPKSDVDDIQKDFDSFLRMHGVTVSAATIIAMLTQKGFLPISTITEISGEHTAAGVGEITALHIEGSAIIKPGTKSTAYGFGKVTGTKIGK